ncbi:MAG TPA: TetR/AcrR family transcriptional regulator [Veillonellaceae bacterium]|nr:TetR/AcrR family transcriptional regulator [Veillonellaceae bacterium]
MARIRKDPEERRKELVDISARLFSQNGYEKTMVQDICQAAGVAKGTFFYYFPSKDAVLKEIFEDWTSDFIAEFVKKSESMSAVEKLNLFMQMSARENVIEPLFDQLWKEQYKDLVTQLWQRVIINRFNPLLREMIAQGNREGSMHVEHTEECLDFFWALTDGIWPDDTQETMTDESMKIRVTIAVKLFEQLLGMEKGTLSPFTDTQEIGS